MTSIETAGSQGSGSEISATLVSLGERFEAVRRAEIQRVRRRLGDLSPDLLVNLAFKQSADPEAQASDRDYTGAGNPVQLMRTLELLSTRK